MALKCTGWNVSVIGAGRSGISAAVALRRFGANVLLSDAKPLERLPEETIRTIGQYEIVFLHCNDPVGAVPEGTRLVVTSPGVDRQSPILRRAVQSSIEVWAEIELAYRIRPQRLIAITGTNGKTTTTALTAHLLNRCGFKAVIAGNISADALKKTLVDAALELVDANYEETY